MKSTILKVQLVGKWKQIDGYNENCLTNWCLLIVFIYLMMLMKGELQNSLGQYTVYTTPSSRYTARLRVRVYVRVY